METTAKTRKPKRALPEAKTIFPRIFRAGKPFAQSTVKDAANPAMNGGAKDHANSGAKV
jgi:hypothetical protein